MNVHISYKLHRNPDIDKEMQHWTAKIQKRLQWFRPELVHLKGSVEQNSPREGATVCLNLRLPSGQMASRESAPTPNAAIKAAFDELLGQIGRHKDLLRNSHRWKGRRSANGRATPEVPFEQTLASIPPLTATGDDVRSYVNANIRRLKLFVERAILLREGSGQLEPDSLKWEEIVDEAVASALDEGMEKPDRMGLEPWLYRLAIRALDTFEFRLAEAGVDVDLQSPRQRRSERASDEPLLQFHQPDETMTRESGIADEHASTPEQIAYSDEMLRLVELALRGTSREGREAFILHAIEGFSVEEIAGILDRKPEHVQESLRKAGETLRRSAPVNNSFAGKLLPQTGTD